MSSDDTRIDTQQLVDLAEPIHVDQLQAWPGDPYQPDVGLAITQSETFGHGQLVLTHNGTVVYGTAVVDAQRHQPDDDGMVPIVDLAKAGWSRQQAERFAVAKWTAAKNATTDDHLLAELLTGWATDDIALLDGTGWDGDDLDALLETLDPEPGTELTGDPDAIPEPSSGPPVTKAGDIWTLGEHRVMCGDCRNPGHVDQLLDGETVNLAFTSPPYAEQRAYDEKSGFKPVPPDEYVAWFEPVQASVAANLAEDGSWCVNIKPASRGLDTETYVLDLVLAHAREWGWHWASEYCWERPGIPQEAQRRFKNQFEPVYQFARAEWKFRKEAVKVKSDAAFGYGGLENRRDAGGDQGHTLSWDDELKGAGLALPGNRLPTFTGSHDATGHGAAFPVGLPDFFVRAYTDVGDAVFDPFMGSGSTLLAAHQNDRVGFGLELSPAYVDIICRRFQDTTGIKPTRDGEPWDFTAEEELGDG